MSESPWTDGASLELIAKYETLGLAGVADIWKTLLEIKRKVRSIEAEDSRRETVRAASAQFKKAI